MIAAVALRWPEARACAILARRVQNIFCESLCDRATFINLHNRQCLNFLTLGGHGPPREFYSEVLDDSLSLARRQRGLWGVFVMQARIFDTCAPKREGVFRHPQRHTQLWASPGVAYDPRVFCGPPRMKLVEKYSASGMPLQTMSSGCCCLCLQESKGRR